MSKWSWEPQRTKSSYVYPCTIFHLDQPCSFLKKYTSTHGYWWKISLNYSEPFKMWNLFLLMLIMSIVGKRQKLRCWEDRMVVPQGQRFPADSNRPRWRWCGLVRSSIEWKTNIGNSRFHGLSKPRWLCARRVQNGEAMNGRHSCQFRSNPVLAWPCTEDFLPIQYFGVSLRSSISVKFKNLKI